LFFVTNRDVAKGDELCFSYIEHELLCENAAKRSALLDMDFELNDDANGNDSNKHNNKNGDRPKKKQKAAKMPSKEEKEDKGGVYYPLIDAEMQSDLMTMQPNDCLDLINKLLE